MSLQATFVLRCVAALKAAVDLLMGVKKLQVLLQLQRVESDQGAEVTAQRLLPGVAAPQVPQEGGLVGGGKVALRAVVGLVRPVVSLHLGLAGKQSPAGVMPALAGCQVVHLPRVSHKFPPEGRLEGAAGLEAAQRLRLLVRLHVSLEQPAEEEAPPTGGTLVAVFSVHVEEVAAHCAVLHGGVLAQRTAVGRVSGLAELVRPEPPPAGEGALAAGALQPGLRGVCEEVLLQVGAHFEAAATLRTGVGAKDDL